MKLFLLFDTIPTNINFIHTAMSVVFPQMFLHARSLKNLFSRDAAFSGPKIRRRQI